VRLYRACPEAYLEVYTGLGASYRDGARWNYPNKPVMYFAFSPSVALLEMSHYIPSPRLVPPNYRMGVYEVPDTIPVEVLAEADWPKDWFQYPYPQSTQSLGTRWLESCQPLILKVPSVAVLQGLESIAVFNPLHSDAHQVTLIEATSRLYNPRMFQAL